MSTEPLLLVLVACQWLTSEVKTLVMRHVPTATEETAQQRTTAADAPQASSESEGLLSLARSGMLWRIAEAAVFTLPFAALDSFGDLLTALENSAKSLEAARGRGPGSCTGRDRDGRVSVTCGSTEGGESSRKHRVNTSIAK